MPYYIFALDYIIKDNKWCVKQNDGEHVSLSDATKACDLDVNCTMFFDFESKNEKFVLCSSGRGIKSSTIFRSHLYVKRFIRCKCVLNTDHYP